jgi:hypothetical protein
MTEKNHEIKDRQQARSASKVAHRSAMVGEQSINDISNTRIAHHFQAAPDRIRRNARVDDRGDRPRSIAPCGPKPR